MAVRKNGGGWVVDISYGRRYDGSQDRRKRKFETKREALAYERAMLVQRDAAKGRTGRITWDDFLEYVYWPQKQGLRANTKRGYERDIKLRLGPAFGGLWLDEINRLSVQQMINSCSTRKVAKNARDTLSSILGVAVDMEIINRNPASLKYTYPPEGEANPKKWGEWISSFADHKRFLQQVEGIYGADSTESRILVLGLCFGLRKGEILGLDWERVDMKRREISIVQTYVTAKGGPFLAPPKTAKSVRKVPISEFAYAIMAEWKAPSCATDTELDGKLASPVVRNRMGKRLSPNTAENIVRRVTAGLYNDGTPLQHVTMMSCRHSFATACIRASVPVSTVSAWLGHQKVSTTYDRYVKPLMEDVHADISMIDAAYAGPKFIRVA